MTTTEILALVDAYAYAYANVEVRVESGTLLSPYDTNRKRDSKAALQSAIESLMRDAERLDYLDKQASFYNGVRMCCLPGELRQIIDAAIAAQEVKNEAT